MENVPNLGEAPGPQALRDAVHIAVLPARAGSNFKPGEKVHVVDGVAVRSTSRSHGLADPFRTGTIKSGTNMWVLLYPGTITSLRHDWTHPTIGDSEVAMADMVNSRDWIAEYAYSIGSNYDELVTAAGDWIETGQYLNKGEVLEGVSLHEDFWHHYEIVTGKQVREADRESFFSCAC